ncbi:MAG: neutral zinc metallopeptidase [Planctomycetota bacterium]
MRWKGRQQSTNVDDRRRAVPKKAAAGGIGTVLLVIVIAVVFKQNPQQLLQQLGSASSTGGTTTSNAPIDPAEEELADFIKTVLRDTEDVWNDLFEARGSTYREPTLVLFRDRVQSACGGASSAMGPFYCPADEQIYIDLSFYEELSKRFKAPGDFAQAYVLAHEVGHHVQNLLGTSDYVHQRRGKVSDAEYNDLSVRLELQADFFAGVWAHHADRTMDILERGDIEEAMRAASAIGDDRLQMQTQGYVVPDSFTHGTSAQRMRWFRLGLETGDPQAGDTFTVPNP